MNILNFEEKCVRIKYLYVNFKKMEYLLHELLIYSTVPITPNIFTLARSLHPENIYINSECILTTFFFKKGN